MSRAPLLLALLLSLSVFTFAQSQANTGNIEGRVTDPNGASVPNVTVTATNLATGLAKNAVTNDEGVYRIVFLTPGAYKVETSGAQGFTTPSVYIFDTRVTKTFKFGEDYSLSFLAEAFNLFNRSNIATVNTAQFVIANANATALTNPAPATPFGGPRTFLGERQIQLGVRFKF